MEGVCVCVCVCVSACPVNLGCRAPITCWAPGQGCILIRSRDIGWIDALDLFWVPIGTMGALGKLKMKYMHQVRSLSTKRRATIAPMGATGEPEMNYAHQVRSLSTKKGGGPDPCRNHVL